ncbi:TIGR03960 family B12-binding radical SAM protein [Helicovermis profundi]|uniref:TIGR03960 family B12-binding radical SAM protein n=1 Tax=Helicovermis profundi TaxID=3065157 RepID=A0AAU9E5G7_9FIRM|nr:TIGR03960 family B12-binding radical SAM protein [Clostridia bacterium S502]
MYKKIEKLLYKVEKPGRYIGNEFNMFRKDLDKVNVRFGFCFPDVYEVGMSHLGMHVLYNIKNEVEDFYCERVFAPWVDMENEMRKEKIELFTLETFTPIKELDMLGFTLQYELSYTNILNMLSLGNIPMLSSDRDETYPIVIAGGICAYNPEPLAEFMDIFVMGEGEEVNIELMNLYKEMKKKNYNKDEFLIEAAKIEGIYVPKLYEVKYKEDGTIEDFFPLISDIPKKINKRIVKNFDKGYYPKQMLVPNVEVVHDRAVIEVFRGCTRGCRFCQAGMVYRPVREKSIETIKEYSRKVVESTGYGEISLASLSTLDYSEIEQLINDLIDENEKDRVGVSLPSLRLDSFSTEVMKKIQKIRKTGLTFAPEAGTQRLRDVINKGISEENIVETLEKIFPLGWSRVKFYFMIGLPTETYEDLDGIMDISNLATYTYSKMPSELKKQRVSVTTSASCFVPKPFTPFQWMAQDTIEEFEKKQKYLRKKINNKKVKFIYHDADTSFLEAVFARGDRKLSKVILKAWEKGAKFDGWNEHFDLNIWMEAFNELSINPEFYAHRERSYDEILPWDFVDVGVSKSYLIREDKNSKVEKKTVDCREGCTNCGVNQDFLGGVC